MRNSRAPQSGPFRDTMSMAGWLFADLLLGLAMLFFVFGTRSTPESVVLPTYTPYPPTATVAPTSTVAPTYTPYPTGTAAPTYTPYPTPTPVPSGLEPSPIYFTLEAAAQEGESLTSARLENEFRGAIRRELAVYGERQAGFVIIFGYVDNATSISEGTVLAQMVETWLTEEWPEMFNGAAMKPLHFIENGSRGKVSLELYFLVDELSPRP